ncbi:MAG: hypothetical protein Kow00114_27220 [Kiloniellaceae bacterium]
MKRPRSKDFDLRCAAVRYLLDVGVPREDIRHEWPLDSGSSGGRVDLAVTRDDRLIGMEIKSASDTVDRLRDQINAMQRAFDVVKVVADTRLEPKLSRGFGAAATTYYSHETRSFVHLYRGDWLPIDDARLAAVDVWGCSRRTTVSGMARLLWRDEARRVAQELGCMVDTREKAVDWLRENARLRDLRPLIIRTMRARSLNRWEEAFWRDFEAAEAAP